MPDLSKSSLSDVTLDGSRCAAMGAIQVIPLWFRQFALEAIHVSMFLLEQAESLVESLP